MIDVYDANSYGAWLTAGKPLPVTMIGLDLTGATSDLQSIKAGGSAFLGCTIDAGLATHLTKDGATVIAGLEGLPAPLKCFPTQLYDVATLYKGFDPQKDGSWTLTPDCAGWKLFMADESKPNQLGASATFATRLHDTSIEGAVARFLASFNLPAVAIMGGHDLPRNHPVFKQVVEIARAIRRKGYPIVTGGGPGLMEAGNLGALLAPHPDDALDKALAKLPQVDFKSHQWLKTAAEARAELNCPWDQPVPVDGTSLAIPTWLYGHEPPNLFSSHIGKMFYNSLREDGLVTVAGGGILFGRGNAGTVQEIFQDMTQNYYRTDLSATPMVFLEPDYWSRLCDDPISFPPKKNPNKPLLPLIRQLAAEKDFLTAILVSSDTNEIVNFLTRAKPKPKPGIRKADVKIQSKLPL